MELKIGNKTYNIEYSVEASLCDDCVEKVTNFMMGMANTDGVDAKKFVIGTMTNLPVTALGMLYGGLMAHHGEDGDNTVTCLADAKKLLKQYIVDHKEDGTGNYYDIIGILIDQMGKDGFFDIIGLTKIIEMGQTKTPKKPTDHKKKNNAVTEK